MATITGIIRGGDSSLLATQRVTFRLASPSIGSNYLVSKSQIDVMTDANGAFSQVLEAGTWTIEWTFNRLKTEKTIAVPAGDGAYLLHAIVVNETPFVYSYDPLYMLKQPPDGWWKVVTVDGEEMLGFWNPVTLLYHPIFVNGPAEAPTVAAGGGVA